MSGKTVRICALSFVLALAAVFWATPGSWNYYRFKTGNYDFAGETDAVTNTIRLFSGTLAGLYVSGGNPAGLNSFPAETMVRGRVIRDIGILHQMNLVLATDRDRSTVKQITFVDPAYAVAIIDEAWFMQLQNYSTRRPVSNKKANIITVRYFLKKQWSKWIVMEYEVYGRGDPILPVPLERVLAW